MNKKEQNELNYFPKAIDEAIKERFGVETEATSEYDFFGSGEYKTYFKAEGEKKEKIEEFIAGFIAGNRELAQRLKSLNKSR